MNIQFGKTTENLKRIREHFYLIDFTFHNQKEFTELLIWIFIDNITGYKIAEYVF